jgi:anaerobic selenocysteine-containing dehydrogenase
MLKRGDYFREVTWEEAIDEVAGRLTGVTSTDFLMVVSPDLSNESLYTAQKFVRDGLGLNSIDSTARECLPGGLGLWSKLLSLPVSITSLRHADAVIALDLDSRFYFSIAGVEIRHALKAGADLVTIDPRDSNLARYTDYWLRPIPGREAGLLNAIAQNLDNKRSGLAEAAQKARVDAELLERAMDVLSAAEHLAVVAGPTAFEHNANGELTDALLRLAARDNVSVVPLYQGANTRGALELGALGEILPRVAKANGRRLSLADVIGKRVKPKVIYLVGEVPFFERPDCEYLIAQGMYYPPFAVDAFLPAASFAETEGTLTNIEGRVQKLVQIEALPDGAVAGFARPDWHIFGQLAQKLGHPELKYRSAKAVLRDISKNVPGFPARPDRKPRRLTPAADLPVEKRKDGVAGAGSYLLVIEPGGFGHCGTDLSSKVEGLGELGLEEGFRLNPEDLRRLKVEPGESVVVSGNKIEVSGPVRPDADCPEGVVYVYRPVAYGGLAHRAGLEPLYRQKSSPVKVEVRSARKDDTKRKKRSAPRRVAVAEG